MLFFFKLQTNKFLSTLTNSFFIISIVFSSEADKQGAFIA